MQKDPVTLYDHESQPVADKLDPAELLNLPEQKTSTSRIASLSKKWVICLGASIFLVFILAISVFDPLRHGQLHLSLAQSVPNSLNRLFSSEELQHRPNHGQKNAYAVFLAANVVGDDEPHINQDRYFVGARLMVYQLLHAPETRTKRDYDVVVLTTEDVKEEKRQVLRDDGAVVVTAKEFDKGWVQATAPIWQSVILKLRLWQLTQYHRILVLDSDIVLQDNLDEVFDGPGAEIRRPDHPENYPQLDKEAPYPSEFVFSATAELSYKRKHYPPVDQDDYMEKGNYMNAGFMLLKPSQQVFDYYMSLTKVDQKRPDGKDLYDKNMPEQALLNYAHRRDGPMPWFQLSPLWTIHDPKAEEMEAKPKSVHAKFWNFNLDHAVGKFLMPWLHRYQGFWEGRNRTATTERVYSRSIR